MDDDELHRKRNRLLHSLLVSVIIVPGSRGTSVDWFRQQLRVTAANKIGAGTVIMEGQRAAI